MNIEFILLHTSSTAVADTFLFIVFLWLHHLSLVVRWPIGRSVRLNGEWNVNL